MHLRRRTTTSLRGVLFRGRRVRGPARYVSRSNTRPTITSGSPISTGVSYRHQVQVPISNPAVKRAQVRFSHRPSRLPFRPLFLTDFCR